MLACACSSLRGEERSAGGGSELRESELGDMTSVAVCGDVWLGEQPRREHLDIAERRGIRTVIALLPPESPAARAVGEQCEALDLRFVAVGDGGELPGDGEVDRALEALADPLRGPALMFCESGARTALVFAVWRVAHDGVPMEDALEAARRCGMKPGCEDVVRAQVERLRGASGGGAAGAHAPGA